MADELARGIVDGKTTLKIMTDGTFATQAYLGKWSEPERLLGFDHDADSMRRKSMTGRGGAALLTGGASLLASNNRGVVYVTVTGERSKVRTYTTRNPSGTQLSSIRSLKAAADSVLAHAASGAPSEEDVAQQLRELVGMYRTGLLTDAEFTAAKARLLG